MRRLRLRLACAAAVLAVAPMASSTATADRTPSAWPSAGQNLANARHNPTEHTIDDRAARRLALKRTYQTRGDVSATPPVSGGAVYFPDGAATYTRSTPAPAGRSGPARSPTTPAARARCPAPAPRSGAARSTSASTRTAG